MEEIIRILEEKISKLKEEEKGKKDLEELKLKLLNYINNPDDIVNRKEEFKTIFMDEDNDTLDLIISLCGLYNYKETQIVNALDVLNTIVNKKITVIDEELNKIQSTINSSIDEYNRILNLLKNYNEETYISEEELLKIKEAVGESEELLKLYFIVAINNSVIEIKQAQEEVIAEEEVITEEEVLSRDVVEDLDDSRALINTTLEEINEETNKKKEYLERIKEFISNEEYKKLDNDLYNLALMVILKAKNILENDKESIDFEFLENELSREDIIWVDGIDFGILSLKELLSAYENNNISEVKEVIDLYKSNASIDIKDYLTLEGLKDYALLLKKLENKYKINENIDSVRGIRYEDAVVDESMQNLQSDIYLLKITYKDILELLENRKLDDNNRVKLEELINKIKTILEKYEKFDVVDSGSDSLKSYYENAENYMVFFKVDEFDSCYEELKRSHYEKAEELSRAVLSKFKNLKEHEYRELITERYSHNIHPVKGIPNSFEILDLNKGDVRLSYKRIEGAAITDERGIEHPVILVLHTCYGQADGHTKNANLIKGVDMFRDDRTGRYAELKRIFAKDANKNGMTDEARAELEKSLKEIEKIQNDFAKQDDYTEITANDLVGEDNNSEELGGNGHGQK